MYFSSQEPQNIIKYVQSVLNTTAPKWGYDVEVKEHKPKRSHPQNDFYWLQNDSVAKFLNEAGVTMAFGLPFTSEAIHEINKKFLGVQTTTKMSVPEFCEYMTRMFSFWMEKTKGNWQPEESPYGYLEKVGVIEKRREK